MFDPINFAGFLLHFALLVAGIVYACRKAGLPRQDWPFLIYLLVWVDLVLTAHIASLFGALGNLWIYLPISFVVLGGLVLLVLNFAATKNAVPLLQRPQLEFTTIENPKIRKFLLVALLAMLAYAAFVSILIGNLVYPDNADSMIYRLPRAFWYASHGSFMHPFISDDNRITYYPVNGVALYIPIVLYHLPGTIFSYPSLVTWGILVLLAYRFARELGAERLLALAACCLVGLTPGILAQANSTNDEILAATALAVGMLMFWRWLLSARPIYFILAIASVGLSAATKPHIVFLLPFFVGLLGVAIWAIRKKPEILRQWFSAIGWRTGWIACAALVTLAVPFMIYNHLSVGTFTHTQSFAGDVFNTTGNLQTIFQNFLIYLSQMMISPIADLNVWPVANDRQVFNTELNDIFNALIGPMLSLDPKHYHFNYRFVGVTLPTSVRFVEFSLWSGFVWLLWPLQAYLAGKQKFPLKLPFILIGLIPAIWLIFWCVTTLYMEGTATYFTFYLACAAPAAVLVFTKIHSVLKNDLRWIIVGFVMLTSLVISHNMFMFSGFRSIPDLFYAKKLPFDWNLAQQPIIDEIRKAERIRIIFTHEKMPYFAYMHWNPKATYYSPYPMQALDNPEEVLQIYPASSLYAYGFMPLKIPNKRTVGMTYLGTNRAIGREVIFAMGNNVHQRHPTESDYIVPQLLIAEAVNGYQLSTRPEIAGLRPDDGLELQYTLNRETVQIYQSPWSNNPAFSTTINDSPMDVNFFLTIAVRDAKTKQELTRATYQAFGAGAWLPDIGEYE